MQGEQDADPLFDPASFFQIEEYVAQATATVDSLATVDEVDADPVGVKDIAKRLGVKQQTVSQWRTRGSALRGGAMPDPRWVVSDIPAWQWADILAWAEKTGRSPKG